MHCACVATGPINCIVAMFVLCVCVCVQALYTCVLVKLAAAGVATWASGAAAAGTLPGCQHMLAYAHMLLILCRHHPIGCCDPS